MITFKMIKMAYLKKTLVKESKKPNPTEIFLFIYII